MLRDIVVGAKLGLKLDVETFRGGSSIIDVADGLHCLLVQPLSVLIALDYLSNFRPRLNRVLDDRGHITVDLRHIEILTHEVDQVGVKGPD